MDKPEYTVEELLEDHEIFHSILQMNCFITGLSGCTDFGMYKQALRELDKRHRALRHLYIQRERLRMKIPSKGARWLRSKCRKLWALADVEAGFALEDGDRSIADTEREFSHFLWQARELKRRVGPLTPERRAVLDEEFWVERLKRTAVFDFWSRGRLNANTLESINAMPREARKGLLTVIGGDGVSHSLAERYLSPSSPNTAAICGADTRFLPGDDEAGEPCASADGPEIVESPTDCVEEPILKMDECPFPRWPHIKDPALRDKIRRNDELLLLVHEGDRDAVRRTLNGIRKVPARPTEAAPEPDEAGADRPDPEADAGSG